MKIIKRINGQPQHLNDKIDEVIEVVNQLVLLSKPPETTNREPNFEELRNEYFRQYGTFYQEEMSIIDTFVEWLQERLKV